MSQPDKADIFIRIKIKDSSEDKNLQMKILSDIILKKKLELMHALELIYC